MLLLSDWIRLQVQMSIDIFEFESKEHFFIT